MQTDPPPSFEDAGQAPPADGDSFTLLAECLRSIGARAVAERWAGWTDQDTDTIVAAAAEIEGIRAALAEGMRQAFDIGREYGHREELLDRVNAEIGEVSSRLARQAWGRVRGGPRGDGSSDG